MKKRERLRAEDMEAGLEGVGVCALLRRSESYQRCFADSPTGLDSALMLKACVAVFWLVVTSRARRPLVEPLIERTASRERRPRLREPNAGMLFFEPDVAFSTPGQTEQPDLPGGVAGVPRVDGMLMPELLLGTRYWFNSKAGTKTGAREDLLMSPNSVVLFVIETNAKG